MDIFYSRILKKEGCINWYKEGDFQDDHRGQLGFDMTEYSEYVQPGIYTSVCCEVDLGFVALNAILSSDDLKGLDKEASKMMEFDNINDKRGVIY